MIHCFGSSRSRCYILNPLNSTGLNSGFVSILMSFQTRCYKFYAYADKSISGRFNPHVFSDTLLLPPRFFVDVVYPVVSILMSFQTRCYTGLSYLPNCYCEFQSSCLFRHVATSQVKNLTGDAFIVSILMSFQTRCYSHGD